MGHKAQRRRSEDSKWTQESGSCGRFVQGCGDGHGVREVLAGRAAIKTNARGGAGHPGGKGVTHRKEAGIRTVHRHVKT
jgi:hypothetical protein